MTFYKKENYTNVYSALYLLVFRISFQKFYGLHKKVTAKMKSLCVLILRKPLLKLHFDYTKGKCEGKLVAKLILGSQKAVSRITDCERRWKQLPMNMDISWDCGNGVGPEFEV